MNTDLTKKTADSSIQTLLLDAITEDGAVCDPLSKSYDEEATDKGGNSDRMTFTRYNRLITDYHRVLKVITGETRSNIYEDIPVIDFLHPENTGFNSIYARKENGDIDASEILPIPPIAAGKTAEDYIIEEDPYTINRIINGEETAELLFNTSGMVAEDPNIQVSPYIKGKTKKTRRYMGVEVREYLEDIESTYKSIRKPELSFFKFAAADVENYEGETAEKYGYDVDDYRLDTDDSANADYSDIVKTTVNLYIDEDVSADSPYKLIKDISTGVYQLTTSSKDKKEKPFVAIQTVKNTSGKFIKKYEVTLNNKDMYLIVPGENTKEEYGVAIIFKFYDKPIPSVPLIPGTSYAIYVLPIDDFSYNTEKDKIITYKYGDTLSDDLFLDNDTIVPILKKYIEINERFCSPASGLLSGFFSYPLSKEKIADLDNETKVTNWAFVDDYIKAKKDYNTEILPGTKYFKGHILGRGRFYEKPLAPTFHDYISTANTYDKVEDSYVQHTPSLESPFGDYGKIKSIKNNDIYILLGDISYNYNSAEKRFEEVTDKNFIYNNRSSLYKLPKNTLGKASILKDVIDENLKNLSTFKGVSLPKKEWEARYSNKPLIKVTDIISKTEYSGEEISDRRIHSLQLTDDSWSNSGSSSIHVLKNLLPYKEKFNTGSNRESAGPKDFEEYFNALVTSNHPDSGGQRIVTRGNDTMLYLSTDDIAVCKDIDTLSENGHIFPKKSWGTVYSEGNQLKSSFNKSFYLNARHFRNKWRWDKQYGSWRGFRGGLRNFDIISPIQTLCPTNSTGDKKVILVYPEYPDIFPDKLFLISSVDLDIPEMSSGKGGMISFYDPDYKWDSSIFTSGFRSNDGKLISFGVSKVKKFTPSNVTKICVYDSKSNIKTVIDRKRTEWESHEIWVPSGEYKRVKSETPPSSSENIFERTHVSNVHKAWSSPDYSNPYENPGNRHVVGYYYDVEVEKRETVWTSKIVDDFPQLTSNLDCYIYELCPLNVSLDGRYFYNQNDEKFDLMSGPGSFIFNPLTYPSKSYFPIIQKEIKGKDKSEIINVVKEGHRRDLKNIKGSIIIPSIPQFDDVSELSKIYMGPRWFWYYNRISLNIFRKMINTEILEKTNTLNNKLILSTLKSWKVSSGNPNNKNRNPIKLEQLPELLKGLSSLEPSLKVIQNTNFEIEKYKKSENGTYSIPYKDIVTKEDLAPLYNRITRRENFVNFEEKEYDLKSLKPAEFAEITFDDFLKANFKTTLGDYTSAILGDANDQVSTSTLRTFNMKRDALESSAAVLNKLFNSPVRISRTTCELLDSYFGLNSGAILRIGSGKTETEDIETVDLLYKKVIDRFEDVIEKADQKFKDIYNDYSGKSAELLINTIKEKEKDAINAFFEEEKTSYQAEKEALRSAIYSVTDYDGSLGSHGFLFDSYLQQPPNPKDTTISFIPTTYENIDNIKDEVDKRVILFRESLPDSVELDSHEKTAAQTAVENKIIETSNNAIVAAIEKHETEIGSYSSKSILELIRDLQFSNPAALEDLKNKNKSEEELEKIRVMRILINEVSNILKEIAAKEEEEIKEEYTKFLQETHEPTESESFNRYLLKYHPGINQGTTDTINKISKEKIDKYIEDNLNLNINYAKPKNETSFQDEDNEIEPSLETPSISPSFSIPLPTYKMLEDGSFDYNEITPLTLDEAVDLGKSSNLLTITSPPINILPIDTTENILVGLSDFIKTSLEGTNPNGETNPKYVEYTAKDQKLMGRPNGLYYRRYQILNGRLHKAKGPLSRISIIKEGLKNKAFINSDFEENVKESYEGAMKAVEVERSGELTYMAENSLPNVDPSIHIPGKYYYPEEISAIKKQIGDQCILTCTRCAVKNTCPYYNEDTLIKANLTPATTIDLWFKDNNLDLLYYNGEEDDIALNEKLSELSGAKQTVLKAKNSVRSVEEKITEKEKEIEELTSKLHTDIPEVDKQLIKEQVLSKEQTLNHLKESKNDADKKLTDKENEVTRIEEQITDIKETKISPNIYPANDPYGACIPKKTFKAVHNKYADIIRAGDNKYEKLTPLDSPAGKKGLKQRLKEEFSNVDDPNAPIDFDEKRDTLGFLIGARYGTVELNPTKALFIKDNPNLSNLPNYNFLYDAVHIADEETEFYYAKSAYKYKVNLTTYTDKGEEEKFEGDTYIQIPVGLKMLVDAFDNDDVYLVSDDIEDDNGHPIEPVIYLGKAKNVRKLCTFDLMEGTTKDTLGAQSFIDSNNYYDFYPSDVAQWCVNYLKGNLIGRPLNTAKDNINGSTENMIVPSNRSANGEIDSPIIKQETDMNVLRDLNENRDQFWMQTIKKPVYKVKDGQRRKEWYSMPGRPRSGAKYQEPVMNPDKLDPNLIVSGKPAVISYFNFIRRMSIQMYDPKLNNGEGDWTIPWVNPNLQYEYTDGIGQTLSLAEIAEYKRKILQFMKTNLRLVVVVSDE